MSLLAAFATADEPAVRVLAAKLKVNVHGWIHRFVVAKGAFGQISETGVSHVAVLQQTVELVDQLLVWELAQLSVTVRGFAVNAVPSMWTNNVAARLPNLGRNVCGRAFVAGEMRGITVAMDHAVHGRFVVANSARAGQFLIY